MSDNTPPPKPAPTYLHRLPKQHIYSQIEEDDSLSSGEDSDHGIYSEPEHIYSCIEDLRLGKRVNVEVEKDSDKSSAGECEVVEEVNKERKKNGKSKSEVGFELQIRCSFVDCSGAVIKLF